MRRRGFIGLAGSALAWPVGARAQQTPAVAPSVGPTIGLLTSENISDWMIEGVRKGLGEAGFVEGRNLTIVYRAAEGQPDRLPVMAADLVNSRVAAILATGGPLPARAAKAATTTIPIVFAYGAIPSPTAWSQASTGRKPTSRGRRSSAPRSRRSGWK